MSCQLLTVSFVSKLIDMPWESNIFVEKNFGNISIVRQDYTTLDDLILYVWQLILLEHTNFL